MNVEIFETHVNDEEQAYYLLSLLRKSISDAFIQFDFKVGKPLLKIETNRDISGIVQALFTAQGVYCQKV